MGHPNFNKKCTNSNGKGLGSQTLEKYRVDTTFENNPHLTTCPECNGAIIYDTFQRETICEQCGLVYSEKPIDIDNLEYRTFNYEEFRDKSRGEFVDPLLVPHIRLLTQTKSWNVKNIDLKRILNRDRRQYYSKTRNLIFAIPYLKRISSNLDLPYLIKACTILTYRKAIEHDLIRGRSILGLLSACFYYACRFFKYPLSLQEISNESLTKTKKIQQIYFSLIKELKLKPPTLNPAIYLSKYINDLNLDIAFEKKALKLFHSLPFSFLNGKEPKSLIGGIIYYLCKKENIKITQTKIVEVSGASEVSIRYKFKDIEKIVEH